VRQAERKGFGMTSVTINLPDDHGAELKANATAQSLTLEGWFQKLAERGIPSDQYRHARAAAARIRELQQRSKPDPDGWTAHDYIDNGHP
jgi:hypothetical protein